MSAYRLLRPVALRAADGYTLAADACAPAAPDGIAVVINAAMGVPRRYYHAFATYLAEHGCGVLVYDYRGIGESAPVALRGFPARLSEWGELDVEAALGWVRASWPRARLMVVGHSVGGQLLGLAPSAVAIERALLVASQSGYWRHWPGLRRAAMWFCWHAFVPVATRLAGMLPLAALGQGEDLPAGVAQQWASWGRLPGYLFDPRAGLDLRRYAALRMPLRAYSFADDHYAPLPAVRALLQHYPRAALQHRHLDAAALGGRRIGHFGFFKPACGDFWEEALAWLTAPCPAPAALMQ